MSYPIVWVPIPSSNYYPGRKGQKILAISHHRMVGTLAGTDSRFKKDGESVSAHFGIGLVNGQVVIHQYVKIDHSAFCHRAVAYIPSNWRTWGYDPYATNTGTVAIEHQDNGGLTPGDPGRGVVPPEVIEASIWLDALLLSGDTDAWKSAGIRWASLSGAQTVAKQLSELRVSDRTLIDHHDISGAAKPYCWRPWAADKVGFPRARYISRLTAPDTSTEGDSLATITITKLPYGGKYTIPAGVKVTGIKLDANGQVAERKEWNGSTSPSSASFDAYVSISSIRGNPFILVSTGYFAGYFLSTAGIEHAELPAPATVDRYDEGYATGKVDGLKAGKQIGYDAGVLAASKAIQKLPADMADV